MTGQLRFVAVNRDVSLWPLTLLLEMIRFRFDFFTYTIGPVAGEWSRGVNRMALDSDRYELVTADVHRKLDHDIRWFSEQLRKLEQYMRALNHYTGAIARNNLRSATNKALQKILSEYRERFITMYRYGWIPNALEGLENRLTERLTDELRPFFGGRKNFSEITAILFAPRHMTTRLYEAHRVFLFAHKKVNPDVLLQHQKQYSWLEFDYDGPGYSYDDLVHRIEVIRHEKSARDPLEEHQRQLKQQRQYMREIDNQKLRARLHLAQELSYWKAERKDQLYHSYANMDGVIGEIGRRFLLSKKQVKHLLHKEMLDLLSGKKIDVATINERMRYCVVFVDRSVRVYTGAIAHRLARTMETPAQRNDSTIMRGQCAFAGIVRGYVCIVNERSDIKKMKDGFVLVSEKTNPGLLPAMRIAGAIVTDQGGITCHAAIISREMKKPCIIGTKIATRVLKDGDRVEVDATKGIVRKL